MSRALNDLDFRFRLHVFEFLARCVEAGIMLMIVDTLRTPAEHAANLAKGVSWTNHSKHLDGLAIDVCPFDVYKLHGPAKLQWNSNDPVWEEIAQIGEACGMLSGHRWKKRDSGHLEYKPFSAKETI